MENCAMTAPYLPPLLYDECVRSALKEDLGRRGDITAQAVLGAETKATATFMARQEGVACGLICVESVFRQLDPCVRYVQHKKEGEAFVKGERLATLEGPARSLLSGERVALNFLTHLSGIASLTRRYVEAVAHTKAHIACTRKTLPNLRILQKYAVACGGGHNHRFGLDDAVLIKDNHIACAGGIEQALKNIRHTIGHMVRIELEVDTLEQLDEALQSAHCPDVIMLDNMSLDEMTQAVNRTQGKVVLEASGNVTLDTVAPIAETGVDLISSGALTHSVRNIDIGLDIVMGKPE
jgi:nicotinate-nucleotide pyrophosphorylase (carboxylating)